MSVDSLREAINERAKQLVPTVLTDLGVTLHKKGWRDCPCSWCATKREATLVIGSHAPRYRGIFVEDLREVWREDQRLKYRRRLAGLERE